MLNSTSTGRITSYTHAAGKASGTRTQLSTLVRPFGLPKTMPLVVHTSGNTVYEEPCLAYLHLHITKVGMFDTATAMCPHCSLYNTWQLLLQYSLYSWLR